jgi:hypothetical protein
MMPISKGGMMNIKTVSLVSKWHVVTERESY